MRHEIEINKKGNLLLVTKDQETNNDISTLLIDIENIGETIQNKIKGIMLLHKNKLESFERGLNNGA